jgi:mono/diheme cytochrome c family protein
MNFTKIIITFVLTLAGVVLIALIYMYSGLYNVSQLSSHKGITEWAAKTTMKRSVKKRSADIELPSEMYDSSNLITGFSHYNEMCVGCHGAPGMEPAEMAEGLYPEPPILYKLNRSRNGKESDVEVGKETAEFFWIIRNGIKMTAMPGFGPTHSDEKIWAITAFVVHSLPRLSPQEYNKWKEKNGD